MTVFLELPKNVASSYCGDETISILTAIVLFVVPAKTASGETKQLLDWKTLLKTPWDIILLFGGGFALAESFKVTKLSVWMGTVLVGAADLGIWIILLVVVFVITGLSAITSNTAT